jgi:hypothetical protein
MFVFEKLVNLPFLFSNNEVERSDVHIFFVFEPIKDLKDGLWLRFWLFELDDCFLSINAIKHSEVFLSYLD